MNARGDGFTNGGIMHGMVVAGHTLRPKRKNLHIMMDGYFVSMMRREIFLFYDIDCGCWMRYTGKKNARLACFRLEDEKAFYV